MPGTKPATALLVLLLLAPAGTGPALAQRFESRDRYIEHFYQTNPRDSAYEAWRRGRWSNDEYRTWYRQHHDQDSDARNGGAAALFGLRTGAIDAPEPGEGATTGSLGREVPAAGGFAAGTPGYMRYCSNKYRSFDPATGTYLGFDGDRHYCR